MKYSPKLKNAMEEIKEVLRKHDIAGVVVLHSPGFGEFLLKVNPSYSCASIDELNGMMKFRAKREDFNNEAEMRNRVEDTSNMIHVLCQQTSMLSVNLITADEMLSKKLGSTHTGEGFSSDTTQNN